MSRESNLVRARHVAYPFHAAPTETVSGAWFACDTETLDYDALVPVHVADQLYGAASGDNDTAAYAYRSAPDTLDQYGAMGAYISRYGTLSQALESATVGPSEFSGLRFRLRIDRKPWLYIDEDCDAARTSWGLYWLRPMLETVRLVAGSDWWPETIRIPRMRSVEVDSLDFAGRSALRYGSDVLAIEVCEQYLHSPLPRFRMAALSASTASRYSVPTDFLDVIRGILREDVFARNLTIRSLARGLGISPRSLQRELGRRGASYSRLVNEVRFNAATALLSESKRSITRIAYDVGYSDPAHFTRAFSRMAGMSPKVFRQNATEVHQSAA